MVALERAGIKVERYVAYEIDKYAIKVSQKNYPNIEHCGDVTNADFTQYKGFDLLIGGSPCFTKGHLVLTDKGYKDISDIKVNDLVLTHTGKYKRVIRTNQREAEIYSLKISGYPEFRTTESHPFYCIKRSKNSYSEMLKTHSSRKFTEEPEWIEVKDLTPDCFCGQHIWKKLNFQENNNFKLDKELCWILGRYVADGHIRKTKRKHRKNSFQYQVVLSIGNNKVNAFKKMVTKRHFSCYPHTQSVYRCVFNSKELLEFIENNGFGNKASNKRIPEFIYNLPIDLQESFLNGYISGDGCYIKSIDKYSCSTVSKELAFGLQRLITSIYSTNVSVSVDNNITKKIHKIGNRIIKSNYPVYTIAFAKGLRKQSVAHMQEGIMWTQVRKVKKTNLIETVYNIEVEEDNSYTVNNCIVHNCTYWSIAKNNREVTPDGIGGQLFMQYVRALKESECKYFIYENNYSIHQNIKDFISEQLGVQPIMINSALVSAQQRKRCYWTNIPGVTQPEDLKIVLKDILENHPVDKKYEIDPKGCAMRGRYLKDNSGDTQQQIEIRKDDKTNAVTTVSKDCLICEPVILQRGHGFNKGGIKKDKCPTITANESFEQNNSIIDPCQGINLSNYVDKKYEEYAKEHNGEIPEIFNPYNKRKLEDKSPTLTTGAGSTTTSATVLVFQPIRIGTIGNGGQGERIYSIKGKSVTLSANGGGRGAKTGLYKIDLPDGEYLIRKLTPIEAERLQTLPGNYTEGISNTQRYKCIGNGWTVDVIAHILKNLKGSELTN